MYPFINSIDNWSFSFLNQDVFIWLQFTGLYDKNGKELYEGDIIQSKPYIGEGLIKGIVFFDQKTCILEVREITDRISPDVEYLYEVLKPAHDSEIIGNLYENPELIKL